MEISINTIKEALKSRFANKKSVSDRRVGALKQPVSKPVGEILKEIGTVEESTTKFHETNKN